MLRSLGIMIVTSDVAGDLTFTRNLSIKALSPVILSAEKDLILGNKMPHY